MTPDEFRALRKRLGLTQAQLAAPAALGMSRDQILRYETGRAPIPRVVELAIHHLAECVKPKRRSKADL